MCEEITIFALSQPNPLFRTLFSSLLELWHETQEKPSRSRLRAGDAQINNSMVQENNPTQSQRKLVGRTRKKKRKIRRSLVADDRSDALLSFWLLRKPALCVFFCACEMQSSLYLVLNLGGYDSMSNLVRCAVDFGCKLEFICEAWPRLNPQLLPRGDPILCGSSN